MAERLHRGNVTVVIPALNEALRIREVATGALAQCERVIVIDDGSDDGTAELVADLPIRLLRHPHRLGKGASLRDGFAEALRQGARAVLTLDGDGQHAPEDIPRLIASGNRHPGAIVIGARLRKRSRQPRYRRIGNDFSDWGIGWACGYRLVDSQSGQRLYPAEVCALRDVPGEGFVFEAQMLISAARELGVRAVSVPVQARYAHAGSAIRFRKSHFRLCRDLYRIAAHTAAQILRDGRCIDRYRRTRAQPPLIDDSDHAHDDPTTHNPRPPRTR